MNCFVFTNWLFGLAFVEIWLESLFQRQCKINAYSNIQPEKNRWAKVLAIQPEDLDLSRNDQNWHKAKHSCEDHYSQSSDSEMESGDRTINHKLGGQFGSHTMSRVAEAREKLCQQSRRREPIAESACGCMCTHTHK